jgi:hypothetical protein
LTPNGLRLSMGQWEERRSGSARILSSIPPWAMIFFLAWVLKFFSWWFLAAVILACTSVPRKKKAPPSNDFSFRQAESQHKLILSFLGRNKALYTFLHNTSAFKNQGTEVHRSPFKGVITSQRVRVHFRA